MYLLSDLNPSKEKQKKKKQTKQIKFFKKKKKYNLIENKKLWKKNLNIWMKKTKIYFYGVINFRNSWTFWADTRGKFFIVPLPHR